VIPVKQEGDYFFEFNRSELWNAPYKSDPEKQ